jgi:hypothetical protein
MADISDAQIDAVIERGKLALETEPRAASARYDRKLHRVVVDLTNGCTFAFPPRLAKTYMARRAGQGTSPAKAAASRTNGVKGGRPRKQA